MFYEVNSEIQKKNFNKNFRVYNSKCDVISRNTIL